jgi:membrane associated rhomboid family serine protease
LAAAAVFFPNAVVFIWFFPMRMREAFWLWLFLELFGSFNPSSMIASAAHLGGLLAGYFYAKKILEEEQMIWWL